MSSRRSFVFKSLFTQDAPPTTKRRRVTFQPGEAQPGGIDWTSQRARIEELHGDHTISEIKDIMAKEGVVASEKQFKSHFKKWNLTKYLKLSEEQWDYIKAKLIERSQQGKRTSFRYKNGTKIPSAKIKRTVERRWPWALEAWTENVAENASSLSSKGLSAYTGSTIGVLTIKAWENVTRFSSNNSSPHATGSAASSQQEVPKFPAIETALAKLNGQQISLADLVSPSLQALADEFEKDLLDRPTSPGIQFVFQRYSYLGPSVNSNTPSASMGALNSTAHHSGAEQSSQENTEKSVTDRLKVLQKAYPRSMIRISTCWKYLECHNCKLKWKINFSDLAWSFADFEFDHLSSPEHRFRHPNST